MRIRFHTSRPRALLDAAILGLLFLARPAAAQNYEELTVDHETWRAVGWNDACGVAVEHLFYPKLGEAMVAEPITTKIGTLVMPDAGQRARATVTYEATGTLSWDEKAVAKAEKELVKGGFDKPGFPETITAGPFGGQPGLAETILSTGTLSPRLEKGWPGPAWRWAGASYNALATCALLAYERRDAPRHFVFLLVRVYNPRVRRSRAYAHASNARLLFDAGNLDDAAVEAENAALLDPDLPIARYEHAAMLALTGRANESVAELAAAVKLDPAYGKKARADIDFADLRRRDDFKALTR